MTVNFTISMLSILSMDIADYFILSIFVLLAMTCVVDY